MKKSQLKAVLTPIVRECVEDVIKDLLLKEGTLSRIIKEVNMANSGNAHPLQENRASPKIAQNDEVDELARKQRLQEARKKIYESVKLPGMEAIFEGIQPIAEERQVGGSESAPPALGDMDPNDPGVSIDGLMGAVGGMWKKFK